MIKSMRLAMTCGYRVFLCSNMAFAGDFHTWDDVTTVNFGNKRNSSGPA
jgi:hypothetical protein